MKLTSVRIQEYKSILDSQPFDVGDITCLVGKNEAGKTAVLEALSHLNPLIGTKANFDVIDDYPRSLVEEYQIAVEQKKRDPAIVVQAIFQLAADEMKAARDTFGDALFKSDKVEVSRGYANQTHARLDIDEGVAVQKLVRDAGLPPEVAAQAKLQPSLKHLSAFLSTKGTEQNTALAAAQAKAQALPDEQEKAKALDEANKLGESQAAKQLRAKLPELLNQDFGLYIWKKFLEKTLPKFLYFDEYYQMQGQLNIEKLRERQAAQKLEDSDHTMLALIDLARLKIDQLLAPKNTQELKNKLEGASVYLSKIIFKYWSQNKYLSIDFDIRPALSGDPEGMRQGTNLWGTVYDSAHQAHIRIGTRSRGFIWFFSFLAWFSQQRKSGHPLILLLDEPGLFLHASAQADLLRYIEEELKPHHQVIYTTHSPFMVDPRHFERVRIVRDKSMETRSEEQPLKPEEEGTKVLSEVLEADEGSIFPLQGALAFDITQTLFVGPNSLIIEGISDMLYIDTMTSVLARAGREGLSDKWTLSPVGGGDKVSSFIALFRNQKGLNIATLIDLQKRDQQKIENIYKEKLLKKKQVLTFVDFTRTSEADIEDMFEVPFYLELVNNEYKKELAAPITEATLTEKHPRVLVRLEKYFEANPLKTGKFNHYRPARYFAENIPDLTPSLSAATLDRFEEAFKMLNALVYASVLPLASKARGATI